MQRIVRYSLAVFFLVAGLNHFVNPGFYHGLIPGYLPAPKMLNALSGLLEVLFGLGVLFTKTRTWAALGILFLLIVFIPSHLHFIQLGSCVENSLCISPWISWVRLLIIHPLLMLWAWYVGFKF